MRIVILASGARGTSFTADVVKHLEERDELTVVVNTAGDLWAHGLKVCPDLDAMVDRLCPEPAAASTFGTAEAIARLGIEPLWLRSDDGTVARQIVRTELLQAGFTLTQATHALAVRGGLTATLLPMSDDRVEQHVVVDSSTGSQAVHSREFATRSAGSAAGRSVLVKPADWAATDQVVEAVSSAQLVVVAPDDDLLPLGTMLTLPGLRPAIEGSSAQIVGLRSGSDTYSAQSVDVIDSIVTTVGPISFHPDIASLIAAGKDQR